MVYDTKGNISIYRTPHGENVNLPIQEKLRDLLLPYVPKTEVYALSISSIHGHRDICFNCEARELLYAIQNCFNGYASFKECIYGKALNIPIESIEKHEHFSKLKLYFRYYFKHFSKSHSIFFNFFYIIIMGLKLIFSETLYILKR